MPAVVKLPEFKERIFIVGANGSGKSYFASSLLEALTKTPGQDRWFAIDLKGDFGEDLKLDRLARIISRPDDWRLRGFPVWPSRILFRPRPADFGSVDRVIGQLFERARKLKKRQRQTDHKYRFYLYCDEALLQSRHRDTTNFAGAAIAGRSLGMGFIVTSQRISWIPVEVRTEAWRIYVFYLSDIGEEKEVIKLTKGKLSIDQLEALGADYSFYEASRQQGGMIKVIHYPKLAFEEVHV